MHIKTETAIIGAGLAGTYCSHLLSLQGREITLIEKSRGTGGRAGSKRLADGASCDIGAPYFQLAPALWQTEIKEWTDANVIFSYDDLMYKSQQVNDVNQQTLYCGKPKMSSFSRYLLGTTPMMSQTRVHHLDKSEFGWILRDDQYQTIIECKTLIITAPAAQTVQLLASSNIDNDWIIKAKKSANACQPQWSVLLVQDTGDRDCVFSDFLGINTKIIDRVIDDSYKQDRAHKNHWVIQATPKWSVKHLNTDPDEVAQILLTELMKLAPIAKINASFNVLHTQRWLFGRHTLTENATEKENYRWDKNLQLGLAGDWLCKGDVEGALLSAKGLSNAIKNMH